MSNDNKSEQSVLNNDVYISINGVLGRLSDLSSVNYDSDEKRMLFKLGGWTCRVVVEEGLEKEAVHAVWHMIERAKNGSERMVQFNQRTIVEEMGVLRVQRKLSSDAALEQEGATLWNEREKMSQSEYLEKQVDFFERLHAHQERKKAEQASVNVADNVRQRRSLGLG